MPQSYIPRSDLPFSLLYVEYVNASGAVYWYSWKPDTQYYCSSTCHSPLSCIVWRSLSETLQRVLITPLWQSNSTSWSSSSMIPWASVLVLWCTVNPNVTNCRVAHCCDLGPLCAGVCVWRLWWLQGSPVPSAHHSHSACHGHRTNRVCW